MSLSDRSTSSGEPSPQAIREQVQKIVCSRQFSRSRALIKFLEYVTEETLEGRADQIKESVLGTSVFNRSNFDPRGDPIVRVQANNLRNKLVEYYANEGAQQRVLIELPKGSYVPAFRLRENDTASTAKSWAYLTRDWFSSLWFKVAMAVLILAAFYRWIILRPARGLHVVGAERLTFDRSWAGRPAITPDGRWMAFDSDRAENGSTDVWLQDLRERAIPVRLTSHPARDETASISPDGAWVAFRSWRDGGGIFLVPSKGGSPRLLAEKGYRPIFSPDGKRIVYSAPGKDDDDDIYVVSSTGGPPRQVLIDRKYSSCPIWTQDGKHILYIASDPHSHFDWFVSAVDEGLADTPIRVGLVEALSRQGLKPPENNTCPQGWIGDEVVFSLDQLRTVRLRPGRWTVEGPVRSLMAVTGDFGGATSLPGGKLAVIYSTGAERYHIWGLPVDANTGKVTGALQVLSPDAAVPGGYERSFPRVSRDNQTLVFVSERTGTVDIWRLNLADRRVLPAVTTPMTESYPLVTSDGSGVLYLARRSKTQYETWLKTSSGDRKICDNCGRPVAWLPGERGFLTIASGSSLSAVDLETGGRWELMDDQHYLALDAALSNDGKWIAVAMVSRQTPYLKGFVIPFPDGLQRETSWIPIAQELHHLCFVWSPEGNLLYFPNRRDGFLCVYAQRLRPADKRPLGSPFAVQHFHTYQGYPANGTRLALTPDMLILTLAVRHGEIWRATVEDWL